MNVSWKELHIIDFRFANDTRSKYVSDVYSAWGSVVKIGTKAIDVAVCRQFWIGYMWEASLKSEGAHGVEYYSKSINMHILSNGRTYKSRGINYMGGVILEFPVWFLYTVENRFGNFDEQTLIISFY